MARQTLFYSTARRAVDDLHATTERHFLHIANQHDFQRIWAIQFELAYSDAQTIMMFLEMASEPVLFKNFIKAYDAVYKYEYAFVAGGLDGFNETFGKDIDLYEIAHTELIKVLAEVRLLTVSN